MELLQQHQFPQIMANFIQQLALVSESKEVDLAQITRVAAALDKQATRDFAPIWGINSSIHAFERLEDVPLGYWPMIVQDDIGFEGAAGIHLDKDGQPYALITSGEGWSLTASHETLEMLADPFGNRVIAGPSIKPKQGRVSYLVEVSDPSEAAELAYTVNDILVSDFYTPSYFDPMKAAGVRYSFTGAITEPREVLKGGYLSWHEPVSDHWFQATFFGAKLDFVDLGVIDASQGSLRSQIDKATYVRMRNAMKPGKAALTTVARRISKSDESSGARAKSLHSQIASLVNEARKVKVDG
jgi:hypothetical protein